MSVTGFSVRDGIGAAGFEPTTPTTPYAKQYEKIQLKWIRQTKQRLRMPILESYLKYSAHIRLLNKYETGS